MDVAATVQSGLDLRSAGNDELTQVQLLKKVLQTEQSMTDAILQSIPAPSHNGTGVKFDYYA